MAIRLSVSYTSYTTSSGKQTGDIITFTHFEEGDLLSENRDDTESDNKYDDDSAMPQLISKAEMDAMDF